MTKKINTLENDNSQFELSYELLLLLKWLAEYEEESLKKIVRRVLKRSSQQRHLKADFLSSQHKEFCQESIIDFFNVLDSILHETIQEIAVKKAIQQNLIPAINQIDSVECGTAILQYSLERATAKLDQLPEENAKQIFFRELLTQWKPHKKTIMN